MRKDWLKDLAVLPLVLNATARLRARAHSMDEQLRRLHLLQRVEVALSFDASSRLALKFGSTRKNVLLALEACANTAWSWCLVLEDDTVLHPHFLDELNATAHALPAGWRLLHLCPAYTWGGGGPGYTKLAPPWLRSDPRPSQRFYEEWPAQWGMWNGGPTAFVVQRARAISLRH